MLTNEFRIVEEKHSTYSHFYIQRKRKLWFVHYWATETFFGDPFYYESKEEAERSIKNDLERDNYQTIYHPFNVE